MTLIIGPSGIEIDVEPGIAEGLVAGGHASYVKTVTETPNPVENIPDPAEESSIITDTSDDTIVVETVAETPDPVEKPRGNAGFEEWSAFAEARGKNIEGLSRDEIRALFKGE
ncbi:hypothetical protein [Microbacterium jejuense]|uniref:hypothetical protein n=1 Tax=Microbacterium jejuense TaxID=1263637 RepID=UPI0031E6DD4E